MKIRDRIIGLERVPANTLIPNPKNWRLHPTAQQNALRGLLAEVGVVDALLVRETPEGYQLIDGHLRAETLGNELVPVLVVDLDDSEADLVLATFDPLTELAQTNGPLLESLLAEVKVSNEALDDMLADLKLRTTHLDAGSWEATLDVREKDGEHLDGIEKKFKVTVAVENGDQARATIEAALTSAGIPFTLDG